jgi:hypothetical protein
MSKYLGLWLSVILSVSAIEAQAQGQCGDPDPSYIILNDADIYDVDGSTLITVIAAPFADDSLIGDYLVITPNPDLPAEFHRIIGNEHFAQSNISTFTVVDDIEGGGNWWFFFEGSMFDIVGSIACEDCEIDDDCYDGDSCTTDACDEDEQFCVYTAYNCDDSDACSADSCVGGACQNTPISCDDGDACTIDSCDSASGCVYDAVDCNDGDACTFDSCSGGACANDPICGILDGCCDASCDPAGDPDCFVCGERGDPCNSNSDCCSNKCKRNGTCK